jgi:hypothetical protein
MQCDAMLKFISVSKNRNELAIARERAENRRRPRFLSHSWHGSPTPSPTITVEEVKIGFPVMCGLIKFLILYVCVCVCSLHVSL